MRSDIGKEIVHIGGETALRQSKFVDAVTFSKRPFMSRPFHNKCLGLGLLFHRNLSLSKALHTFSLPSRFPPVAANPELPKRTSSSFVIADRAEMASQQYV